MSAKSGHSDKHQDTSPPAAMEEDTPSPTTNVEEYRVELNPSLMNTSKMDTEEEKSSVSKNSPLAKTPAIHNPYGKKKQSVVEDASVATAAQDNLSGRSTDPTRCRRTLPIPPTPTNPKKKTNLRLNFVVQQETGLTYMEASENLARAIKEVMEILFKNKIVVYPYLDSVKKSHAAAAKLNRVKGMTLLQLREIFIYRGFTGAGRTSSSFSMHLGADLTPGDLKKKTGSILQPLGCQVYDMPQVEKTIELGWLKYTHSAVDTDELV
jgi:hypothetical protein